MTSRILRSRCQMWLFYIHARCTNFLPLFLLSNYTNIPYSKTISTGHGNELFLQMEVNEKGEQLHWPTHCEIQDQKWHRNSYSLFIVACATYCLAQLCENQWKYIKNAWNKVINLCGMYQYKCHTLDTSVYIRKHTSYMQLWIQIS